MTKNTRGFVHLHVHTEYSPLDGMAILDRLVDTAVADGQPAIACTDHGSLGAAWRLNKLAQAAGIKAIIGEEVYMAIGGRFPEEQRSIRVPADEDSGDAIDADKPTRGAHDEVRTKERGYEHLTLLAINQAGWRNLVTMHNKAQETYSTKGRGKPQPLMDYTLLRKHREGIIILTGCLGSAVLGSMSRAVAAEARAAAAREAGREDIATSELETAQRERQRSRIHLQVGALLAGQAAPELLRLLQQPLLRAALDGQDRGVDARKLLPRQGDGARVPGLAAHACLASVAWAAQAAIAVEAAAPPRSRWMASARAAASCR